MRQIPLGFNQRVSAGVTDSRSPHTAISFLSWILLSVGLLSGISSAKADQKNIQYIVDPAQSIIKWTGKKLTGSHSGTVSIREGSIVLSDGIPKLGSVSADLSTIKVVDITDPTYNAKLANHLKSEDFFNVATFPVSTFEIGKVEQQGPEKNRFLVSGTLTIGAIKQSISFPAHIDVTPTSASAQATLSLDRTLWNIRYSSGKFFEKLGDKLIYDDFDIELSLVAKPVVTK